MNPELHQLPVPEDDIDDSPYAETNNARKQYKENLSAQRRKIENSINRGDVKPAKKATPEPPKPVHMPESAGIPAGKAKFDEFFRRLKAGEDPHDVKKDLYGQPDNT